MDFQTLFNGLLIVTWAGVGFLVQRVFKRLDDLERQDRKLVGEIHEIRENLPSNYVTKDDLRDAIRSLEHHLERIEIKLDGR